MMNTYVSNNTDSGLVEYAALTSKVQNNGSIDKKFEGEMTIAKKKNITVCDIFSKWKFLCELGVDTTRLLDNSINQHHFSKAQIVRFKHHFDGFL